MSAIFKPRAKRVQMMTHEESDMHTWLARLAVVLSMTEDPSPAMNLHVRKTLDEFCESSACSPELAAHVRTR